MEKANLRYRLSNADVKKPLGQVQARQAEQAELIKRLAEAMEQTKKQISGNEQVLDALQSVAAKQFQVSRHTCPHASHILILADSGTLAAGDHAGH